MEGELVICKKNHLKKNFYVTTLQKKKTELKRVLIRSYNLFLVTISILIVMFYISTLTVLIKRSLF